MLVYWIWGLLLVQTELTQITFAKDYFNLLSPEERQHIFGTSIDVSPDVVLAKENPARRVNQNSTESKVFSLNGPNVTYLLHLQTNQQLLSPYLQVRVFGENKWQTKKINSLSSCFFHGRIENEINSSVAVSSCSEEGLKGVILLSTGRFLLHPVPMRLLSEDDKQGTTPHFLFPAPDENSTFEMQSPISIWLDRLADWFNIFRSRKNILQDPTIETYAVVDDALYNHTVNRLLSRGDPTHTVLEFILTIFNGAQMMYNHNTLDLKFSLILTRIDIFKTEEGLPHKAQGEAEKYLENFSKWQSLRNRFPDDDPRHWDYATLFTGIDLYHDLTQPPRVLGIAWINGMCDDYLSSSLNKATSFGVINTFTHETGHSLGMHHDGVKNNCQSNKYIMSPTAGGSKVSWSSCSEKYMKAFLTSRQSDCLKDKTAPSPDHDHELDKRLPGQRFNASDQCSFNIGEGTIPQVEESMCSTFYCSDGTNMMYARAAIDGTICGEKKICLSSKCVVA